MARVLILFHGMPPHAGAPVVGQGLRAYANGEGLRAQGHDVVYCTRSEDLPALLREGKASKRRTKKGGALTSLGGQKGGPGNPYSFTETSELEAIVEDVAPDVVLVEALEDTRRLPDGDFAIVLDLYAPRILEAQYQEGTEERDIVRLLDAIQRADHFLFSNARQKHFFLPLLTLGGVDCTRLEGDVVPISCPPETHKRPARAKGQELRFIAGGVFWPWANLGPGLRDLVALLDEEDFGRVQLLGGKYGIRSGTTRYTDPRNSLPSTERLTFSGIVPIDELWSLYGQADVAFDLMVPSAERSLNLSFRQLDYLRCGLPIITAPNQVIADELLEYGAGWCVEPGDEASLKSLLLRLRDTPALVTKASKAAQKLAKERYSWSRTTAPLAAFVASPVKSPHGETFLSRLSREQADLWEDRESNKQLRTRVARYQSDLEKKSAELTARNRSAEEELAAWERERRAIRDEAGESVALAREQKTAALLERDEMKARVDTLAAQVTLLQADVKKKTKGLLQVQSDLERLNEEQSRRAQETWAVAERQVKEANRERDLVAEKLMVTETRLIDVEAELAANQTKLHDAHGERDKLRAEQERRVEQVWTRANSEVLKAQSEASDAEDHLVRVKLRLSEVEDDVRRKTEHLMEAERERERIQQEADQQLQEVWRSANAQTIAAQKEAGDLRNELAERRAKVQELEQAIGSKEEALAAAHWERDEAHQNATRQIEQVWSEANAKVKAVQQERGEALAELDQARARVKDFDREIKKRDERIAELLLASEAQNEGAGRVEELNYELGILRKEVEKKSHEIAAAQAQRDAANQEKEALRAHAEKLEQQFSGKSKRSRWAF